MKRLSLILRIVAILAAAAAVFLYVTSKGKLTEKQTALVKAKAATKETKSKLVTVNSKLSSAETKLSAERKSLANNKAKLESVRSEMYAAQQDATGTKQQLEEANNAIADLETTASGLRENLVKSEKALIAANRDSEFAELNDRIEEMAAANESLELKLEAAEKMSKSRQTTSPSSSGQTGAGGYHSSFSPNTTPAVQPASVGAETTIASISGKDGIIVLNATAELGLSAGAQITLVRDFKALAKIQIIEVTETFAVAHLLPGASARSLSVGSTVKLLR